MLLVVAGLVVAACSKEPSGEIEQASSRPLEVVLYSSADGDVARLVAARFEARTGVHVRLVGDTEATKTTGLVQRLIAEKDRPRADVWWSSEQMGTMRLAEADVLESWESMEFGAWTGGVEEAQWSHLRDDERRWYAFAARARVLAYNSQKIEASALAGGLGGLADGRFTIGLARPHFGTTGTHLAALYAHGGEKEFRRLLLALKERGARLYDGNASVVRAVATGEVAAGLTDTDDVWSGQRNNWPVEPVFERAGAGEPGRMGELGTVMIPNTVGIVRSGPNRADARLLAEFLLSEEVERLLAESDSHNIPTRPVLRSEFQKWAPPAGAEVWPRLTPRDLERPLAIFDEVFSN